MRGEFAVAGQRVCDTAAQTAALGRELGSVLRAGDVVILDGPLGAGKTTLTQGIAQGLGVRGRVTSPTFVIAREH
ncbi:tRNA (adenosine(37)-N6)-threonylcarbamoyltransferase complex ATPase subunit type 1 TsaE, partial [Corynebacterium sp.]